VKDNRDKTKKHLEHRRKLKRPNPNSLPLSVAGAVVVALGIGAGLFWLMYELFSEQANLYDVTRTVIAALAALTVGGAAVIQYRKHKIAEIDLADTHDAKMSERLSMAIEHLAADKLHIRIGALYELRRLAEDSPRDRASIQEIVTQFLNGKRGEIEELSRASADKVPRDKHRQIEYDKLPSLPSDIADITVALNTLFFLYENYRDDNKEDCKIAWDYLDARYLNLSKLPFVNASLREARFESAYFSKSHFDGADLKGAHFDGAELWHTYFDGADLYNTHFNGAKFDYAHFNGAKLKYAHFDGAKFNYAHFNGAKLEDAHFDGADLYKAHFDGAKLESARFDGAKLVGAHFDGANLYYAHFDDAKLNYAHFDGARLYEAHFDRAYLRGAYFDRADFWKANFDSANICGVNFSKAFSLTSFLRLYTPELFRNVTYDKETKFWVRFKLPASAKLDD
jgi:uncharacterized protein YjbI with pentapeptide repeats